MNARPDDQPYDGNVPAGEAGDDVPSRGHGPAPSTWVPPESPEIGTRPAWLPPGTQPGQPYGPPPGEAYGATSPGWPQPPYAQAPYGQPPYGQPPYGGQQPYGAQPGYRKPRMPRWAKIVLIVGIIFYGLSFIAQMVNMLVLER